ncbi:MAG: hypothetical protein RL088_466 [Verrucomicrobiota bacterium]
MSYPVSIRTLALMLVLTAGLTCFTGCSKKSKAEDHKKRADSYFAAKDFAKAEIEYLNVLKQDRGNVDAIKRLAVIYFDRGKIQQALPYMMAVRELDKNDIATRIKIAQIFVGAGKIEEARKEVVYAVEQTPGNDDAIILLSDTSATPDEIADARKRLEKIKPGASVRAAWNLAMAGLSLREGDFPAAEAGLKKAEEIDPKSSKVHLSWAVYYVVQKDFKNAVLAMKTAAGFAPLAPMVNLRYAEFVLRQGQRKEGREILEQFLKKVPDSSPVLVTMAKLEYEDGRLPECAKIVDQVLASDSGNYQARLLKVGLVRQQGTPAEAVKVAEEFRRSFEKSAEAWFELSLAYLKNRELEKATESVQETLKLSPQYVQAQLLQAELLIGKGESDKALPLLESIVKRFPELHRAQLLLGGTLAANGRLDDALSVYRMMEQKFPKAPDVPFLMGMTHRRQPNGNADARKAFERAAVLSPNDVVLINQLVELDILDKKFDAGMERVNALLAANPKSGGAKYLEARIHIAQGKSKEAEAALKQAIEFQPNASASYDLLTNIYVAEKRLPEALANLDAALQKNAKNVQALMQRALIFEIQGEKGKSIGAYSEILKFAPDFVPALNNLSILLSDQPDRLNEAMELASKAFALVPQEPAIADTVGWIHYLRREYPRALALLKESAVKLPDNVTVQYHLAMAYYMSGEEESARKALKNALLVKGDFPERAKAEKRVAILELPADVSDEATVNNLKSALVEQPDDLPLMLRLGMISERGGAHDMARKYYEDARSVNPASLPAIVGLVRLYSGPLKDAAKAMVLAKEARKLSPEDPEIAFLLGRLAAGSGDHQWASDLLQESSRKQPGNKEGLFQLALSTYAVGRVSEAEEIMTRATAGPATPDASIALAGDALKESAAFLSMVALSKDPKKRLEAESMVQQALKERPNFLAAEFVSGLIKEQRGNTQEARQTYEKIVAAFPRFAPARKQLAGILTDQAGDQKKALDHAMKAREALGDDVELTKILGKIAYRQADYPTAVRALETSSAKLKDDPEVFYFLGMAHHQQKAKAEAIQALERCVALAPDAAIAIEAKKTLALLAK